ncbi:TetR/AcrR family transcriptional regulator [Flavobacterium hiemivividum]|uniref:TetR/AcrR family transcriptional regulator n=1 Tax=Flavobacterium hiemivividum TaxID=2541734 RepID=A0A4R5CWC2_9FLAO|nr:TetR/AcrR family transcriptional regulator [Flavobacterium hiemivividum]
MLFFLPLSTKRLNQKVKLNDSLEKIFYAAGSVFQKKGFARACMKEIAAAAGINKVILHYCFKNK